MIDKNTQAKLMSRMKEQRKELVKTYPFFGELLMNLQLAVAEVGTACTDGKYVIIDPVFADCITDEMLQFIYMHELMHVVFLHCYRRNGRNPYRWNVACDLVVNSNILVALGLEDFSVNGENVMHLIKGTEACNYTAEEVYEMLPEDLDVLCMYFPGNLDCHDVWDELAGAQNNGEADRWKQLCIDVTSKWYGNVPGIAAGNLREYKKTLYKAQLKWKKIVRDFIKYRSKDEDYGFRPPDRRFQEEEFIFPGLNAEESAVVEHIWFFIDKSGSIRRKMLLDIVKEIEAGLRQVRNMSGWVSFFDAEVTKPVRIGGLRDFLKMGIPLPDGGTCFLSIFRYVALHCKKFKPAGIIILTDGYAKFPERNILGNVPVLWIIVNNPDARPPFGKLVHIDSSLN